VKDLARSTLGKASSMTLDGGDPLEKLYGAVEVIILNYHNYHKKYIQIYGFFF